MLKIRLARIGKKKSPTYRIIISESTKDTYGHYLELLGHYNPFSKVCDVKKDRVLYWMEKGAQLSPTIHNLFVDQNVINGPKIKAFQAKKKEADGSAAPAEVKTEAKPEAPAPAPVEEVKAE